MTVATLIAASFSFTATATGVAKGTPVEFMFAGKGSDRDYETMFVLDISPEDFCNGIEKAGIPRGNPPDTSNCVLWPVGCPLTLEPPLDDFVERQFEAGCPAADTPILYTGGTRRANGRPEAQDEMPLALFSLYTLAQSPLLFDGSFGQGDVYGHMLAKATIEKGRRFTFTLNWDDKTRPNHVDVEFKPGALAAALNEIRYSATNGPTVVKASFNGELSLTEAVAAANALAQIDSVAVKVNGRARDGFFYRAFLPVVKWLDRKERLVQPFELHLSENAAPRLLFIKEDWSGDAPDPALTEKEISFADAVSCKKTDTCFIYAPRTFKLSALTPYLAKLPDTVKTFYIYGE